MSSRTVVAASLLGLAAALPACEQCESQRSASPRTRRDVVSKGAQIDEGTWTIARAADGATVAFVSVIPAQPGHWDEYWLVDATVQFPLANLAEYTFTGTGPIPVAPDVLCATKRPLLNLGPNPPRLLRHHVTQSELTCPGE
jgi:hypothetical protein